MPAAHRLLSSATVAALAAGALAAAPTQAATTCKAHYVKHLGACVHKPPTGLPYAGYYTVAMAPDHGFAAIGLQYHSDGWRALVKLISPVSTAQCANGQPQSPRPYQIKGEGKVSGKGFHWTGQLYQAAHTDVTATFASTTRLQATATLHFAADDGSDCTVRFSVDGRLVKAPGNNVLA